jgi:hypothetical protein
MLSSSTTMKASVVVRQTPTKKRSSSSVSTHSSASAPVPTRWRQSCHGRIDSFGRV